MRKLEKQLFDILSLVSFQAVRLWKLSSGDDPAAAWSGTLVVLLRNTTSWPSTLSYVLSGLYQTVWSVQSELISMVALHNSHHTSSLTSWLAVQAAVNKNDVQSAKRLLAQLKVGSGCDCFLSTLLCLQQVTSCADPADSTDFSATSAREIIQCTERDNTRK